MFLDSVLVTTDDLVNFEMRKQKSIRVKIVVYAPPLYVSGFTSPKSRATTNGIGRIKTMATVK